MSIGFLRPYVADALDSGDVPLRFRMEDSFLTWAGWGRPLSIRAVGVRALDRQGRIVAVMPQADIGVSLRALARGMFAPTRIDLIGPRARVLRAEDGSLSFQLDTPEGSSGEAFDELVAVLLAPTDPRHPLGYLRGVSVTGARLDIEDRSTGQSWLAPAASVLLTKDERGIRMDASLDVDLGGAVGHVDGEAEYRAADRTSKAVVWFDKLSPAVVAGKFPQLKPLAALEAPVTGYVSAALDPGFAVKTGEIELNAGAGRISYPEFWPDGLEIKSAHAKATISREPDHIEISELSIDAGPITLAFKGLGTKLPDSIAIAGEVTAASSSIDSWGTIWPKGVAESARAWITSNMERGSVPEAHASLSLRLLDDPTAPAKIESVAGTFRVVGTTVHYLRPLEPVTGASGTGSFDADRIAIKLSAGTLRGLHIEQGTVNFTKLDRNPSYVDINLAVRGPLRDPLEVLDSPRFRYMQKLGIDPKAVVGESATRLVISLPTLKEVKMSEIGLKVTSNLEGVAIQKALLGRDLTDGTLSLKLDNGGMDLSGTAKVAGLPAEIDWFENFEPKDPIARRYRLKAKMDDVARAAFGLDLTPYLTGPTPAELIFVQPAKGPSDLQLRLALDDASLAISDLDWKKPPGQPGTATVLASLDGGKLRSVSNASVEAPKLKISASADFAPDGTPSRIDIARLQAGATDLKGSMTRRPDRGWDVDLSGPSLNASKLVHPDEDKTAPKREKPPLSIALDVGKVWLRSDTPIEQAKGRLTYSGTEWSAGTLEADLPQGHKLSVGLAQQNGGSKFSLSSDDAGTALRIFGIYDDFRGGKLAIEAARNGGIDAPWKGAMAVTEFRAVRAPGLAKLLTVASLTGIASILSGQGIYFARLDMPFTATENTITLEKARMVGSEIGLTADGDIDFVKDHVKVTGTIVPAYTLNSLLGNIPLLGRLFTGSEGSGLFAATYKLEGPMDDPAVSVNPLAMLAPGFLRTLIEGIFSGAQTGSELPQIPTPD